MTEPALAAHRERRRQEAEATGQRVEETGGQPVTFGLTRASELVRALEKITSQHADTLARAIAELRAVGDIESAEAEVYAARTSADQRVATAEARLAEEIQRRRDAEAERDDARADREQADDATAQAIARMEELERQLTELRTSTAEEIQRAKAIADAAVRQARSDAERDISAAREQAARQVADATARAEQAERDAEQAHQAEVAAIEHAHHAQAAAADEAARIRADHREALDQLTAATSARITALEETRDALKTRAERAEADLDTARADNKRLAERLAEAARALGSAPTQLVLTGPDWYLLTGDEYRHLAEVLSSRSRAGKQIDRAIRLLRDYAASEDFRSQPPDWGFRKGPLWDPDRDRT